MRKSLALVCAACVLALTPFALADEGQSSSASTPSPSTTTCTPLKQIYSEKNWRDAKPVDGREVCPVRRRAGKQNTVEHFYLYRHYRGIATMRCLPGSEGYFVPNPGSCSTLSCESGFSWSAYNPSGAEGIYQLLGHGQPWPVRSFRDRLAHHEIAATLSRSSWVC